MGQPGSSAIPTQIGRYRVEGQLGAGGVGVVYAAHDPVLGRRVAVKLLRPDRLGAAMGHAGDRLREEAQAMAKLAHPNVVTVYDVGEHEDGVYIAMELVEGRSLCGWMSETARPWREVLGAYFQAARGLAAAHDAGLVHCDFKPANVLVGRDGRVRVVDFGLASVGPVGVALLADDDEPTPDIDLYHRPTRLTDVETTIDESGQGARSPSSGPVLGPETTGVVRTREGPRSGNPDLLSTLTGVEQTMAPDFNATQPRTTRGVAGRGIVVGTPAYMAPEVFLGRPADARSDQFSLCVALYEGLYERRPFAGNTAAAIADAVLAGRLLPPPEHTRVPKWVHAILEQGLSLRRQDRHPSVRSMLASIAFIARVVWD